MKLITSFAAFDLNEEEIGDIDLNNGYDYWAVDEDTGICYQVFSIDIYDDRTIEDMDAKELAAKGVNHAF